MQILVLGAYGLIGSEIVRALRERGHGLVALGRSAAQRDRLPADVGWVNADLAQMQKAEQWESILRGIDIVVNAAGALQDGSRDDLEAIHHLCIAAMVSACKESGVQRIVQISAPGAKRTARTEFLRSKSRGDDAIRRGAIEWVILRPGLVLAPNAYGGSALLRMAAALPWAEVAVMPESRIQTVSIDDVAECVLAAVDERVESGSDIEVLEIDSHSLAEVIRAVREWLGFPPAKLYLVAPRWLVYMAARLADGMALFGWRSPLRTTAIMSLEDGVMGDARGASVLLGRDPHALHQTLGALPSTLQERWFARLYLAMPMAVATLAAFWIVSGVVGLIRVAPAAAIIPSGAASPSMASMAVIAFSFVDIALGVSVLFRRAARRACGAMIIVSFFYLLGATVLTPALWLDPLGPLVKVLPGIALAWVAMAVLEER
jgi:uncharacterized protein YbjT (DUF2867 family)